MASGNSVLIIHRGALGDFVLAFPLLAALRQSGFTRRILVSHGSHIDLALHLGLCEAGYPASYADVLHRVLQQEEELGQVIAMISGEPEAAFKCPVLFFPPFPSSSAAGHLHRYIREKTAGLGLDYSAPLPDRWEKGAETLIHPGSGSAAKNFEPALYIALQEALNPARFLLGPVELENGFSWPGPCAAPPNLVELAKCLCAARAVIANDSGVAHLSAYLGVPTLALFKSTQPEIWGPAGKRCAVLAHKAPSLEAVLSMLPLERRAA